MANEFIARKGIVVLENGAKITGSANVFGDVSASGDVTGVNFRGSGQFLTDVTASNVQFSNVLNKPTLVSASSQIDHNATTNYVANEHINHATVSMSAGLGLTGGGDLTTSRTFTLDTGSTHFTAGVKTKLNTDGVFSSSAQVNASQITGIDVYAVTSSNTFTGIQTISDTTQSTNFSNGALIVDGGVGIAKNLNVSGNVNITGLLTVVSMSTQYVTSSQYTIGTSRVIVNDDDNVRFAGLSIVDSGSSAATASILWDSLNNHFIYETDDIHNGNVDPHSALLLAGPETYNLPGNEIGLVTGRVPVAVTDHNLDNRAASSSIRIDFSTGLTHIEAGLQVTGSITSSVGFSGNGAGLTNVTATSVPYSGISGLPTLVSASSQIDHNTTTNYVANQHIDHTTVNISAGNGLTGGGDISATRTLTLDTGSTHFTNGVKTKLNAEGVFSSSAQVSYTGLSNIPSGIISSSTQFTNPTAPFTGSFSGSFRGDGSLLTGIASTLQAITNGGSSTTNQVQLNGGATIHGILFTSSSATGIAGPVTNQVVATFATASYDSAHFDYVVKDGTNYRTGTVMTVWNSSNGIEFTDTSTNDIGNTLGVVFTPDLSTGNVRLKVTTPSGTWAIKTAVRML
jgi:hypothetical protein